MQVDLFKKSAIYNEAMRLGSQVETRKFRLGSPLSGVTQYLEEYPHKIVEQYLSHLQDIAHCNREYYRIGSSAKDNLWELECLGIGEYSRPYTIVIDLSDALDFVMHCEFGCPIEDIRAIHNYHEISSAMLNFEFDGIDSNFSTVINASALVEESFGRMMQEFYNSPESLDTTAEERVSRIVYKFYTKILSSASNIRNYVVSALQDEYRGKIIYRSKTFSKAILSSDIKLDTAILLRDVRGCEYNLNISSYNKYEWAKEGIIYELNRATKNR